MNEEIPAEGRPESTAPLPAAGNGLRVPLIEDKSGSSATPEQPGAQPDETAIWLRVKDANMTTVGPSERDELNATPAAEEQATAEFRQPREQSEIELPNQSGGSEGGDSNPGPGSEVRGALEAAFRKQLEANALTKKMETAWLQEVQRIFEERLRLLEA